MPFSWATSRMVMPSPALTREPFMVTVISFTIPKSYVILLCIVKRQTGREPINEIKMKARIPARKDLDYEGERKIQ